MIGVSFLNLIFLGAPGAGKGTQAEIVSEKYHIPAVSTGNIIREALKNGTPTGLQAKAFIDAGKLVPDDVVIAIIKERLVADDCKNGFILDGFPRTIPQAEALDAMGVPIDKVVNIFVGDDRIVTRMSGRRVCSACGNSYHLDYKRPKAEGVCDACGGALVQRKDDAPETVSERLRVYHEETQPLEDYYEKKGKLFVVEGQEKVEDTTALTLNILEDNA